MSAIPSPSSSKDSLNLNPHVVDGVTSDNGGGREEGDVELALFRRIRSISSLTDQLEQSQQPPRSSMSGYRRYLKHPLSMFASQTANDDAEDADNKASDTSTNTSANSACTDSDEEKIQRRTSVDEDDQDDPGRSNLHVAVSTGVAWRDALIQACATLLGKTVDELKEECDAVLAASASKTTFSPQSAAFEPIPRDLADYVIITTLKQQDPMAMENASSWLFNMMDRTGAGFVLRDEFVRYAPFIGHVADFAVAGIVFDELVREQIRLAVESDDEDKGSKRQDRSNNNHSTRTARSPGRDGKSKGANIDRSPRSDLHQRKRGTHPDASDTKDRTLHHEKREKNSLTTNSDFCRTKSDALREEWSRDLYPPSLALRFDTWRRFFLAVQDKYNCVDDDWVRVKRECGIDSDETLIKAQGALDHSDLFPTLGKLFLSQRYLIFFAAVGRNHYVIRLGAVADITTASIPLMMRDCMRITLESETKAAMDGVSAVVKEEEPSQLQDKKSKADNEERQEMTQSQHIGKLMRHFMAGRKALMFSLLEFRERKRRDNWVNLVREMVAAHKLHVQLGFGSSARAARNIHNIEESVRVEEEEEVDNGKNDEKRKTMSQNYMRSPFRGEPSTPLLAVAAHSNIVRYRALRRVTRKRVSNALLVFSRGDRNPILTNWYTDSVRAYESQSGRTWIERALAAIRDNMEINKRMYHVQDDEPFDVGKLGDAIGRLAELCAPPVRVIQFFDHLIQWRNPPATILAVLVCTTIAANGLVHYVPSGLVFLQACWVVEMKYNWLGLGLGGSLSEDAEQRQRNVLEMVAQVHDTLTAAQNVLSRMNRELGKLQALFLWGSHKDSDSWIAVGTLCFVAFILMVVPTRSLFLAMMYFMFFKHFLPPSNPALRFWQTLPSRIVVRKKSGNKQRPRSTNSKKKTSSSTNKTQKG